MTTNRTIVVTGIEPALMSIRHPLGTDLDLTVTMQDQRGEAATSAFPQLVLLPRSKSGYVALDMDVTDTSTGATHVTVPGAALLDFTGYNIELYHRKEGLYGNPPTPTGLAAIGLLALMGSSYQQSSLYETILPAVVGPTGPPGPPGTPGGPPGQRGSIWLTGNGVPTMTEGLFAGDMYLDNLTGDVWRYNGMAWTRGTF